MKTRVNNLRARNCQLKKLKINSYSLKFCDLQSFDMSGGNSMQRKMYSDYDF